MIIWLLFLFVMYCLIGQYGTSNRKKLLLFFIIFVAVYFSTFRDGMGWDYTAYQSYCQREIYVSMRWLYMEPIPMWIYSFCYNTRWSAVVFFFITSLLTCGISLWVYSRNKNFGIAAFVFITYTNLYLASFNLVRQYVASSIILLGTYFFVIKKKNPLFFLFIFIAFLWHKSSIICLFIYFINDKKINSSVWISAIVLSWILPLNLLFKIPFVGNVLESLNYLDYLTYSTQSYSRFSLANLYMHVIVLLFLIKCKKNRNYQLEDNNGFYLALKLTILSVIFSNVSANSLPFAYRYAMFFSPFIPMLFSYLPMITKKRDSFLLVIVPIFILLMTLLVLNMNSRVYCPERILPIESVYDENYRPYENPEVKVIW